MDIGCMQKRYPHTSGIIVIEINARTTVNKCFKR
jgi:hypothetical protein